MPKKLTKKEASKLLDEWMDSNPDLTKWFNGVRKAMDKLKKRGAKYKGIVYH